MTKGLNPDSNFQIKTRKFLLGNKYRLLRLHGGSSTVKRPLHRAATTLVIDRRTTACACRSCLSAEESADVIDRG